MTFCRSVFDIMRCGVSSVFLVVTICELLCAPIAAAPPDIAPQLSAGKLAEAQQMLEQHLAKEAADDLARFQLGTVQLTQAIEGLAQDGVRYGALRNTMFLPFLRVGGYAAGKGEPQPVTYEDVRAMLERFQKGVAQAEATLAPIKDNELVWELDLQKVRLDLEGDGEPSDGGTLGMLFRSAAGRRPINDGPQPVLVRFDSADVYWLRGYCHLLSALADMILAYDHSRLFEVTAHAFFAQPKTEFAARRQEGHAEAAEQPMWESIPDLIAAIHLMNFKLREPKRLLAAQQHLLETVRMSRKSWDLIVIETDNEREWIPGPNQQSVIEGLEMNPERIKTWRRFLDEAEAVIKGEKLIPFWRQGFEQGINLDKAFREPRDFDLVLWVQGIDALPYLEEGEKTSPETWQEFQRVFRGEFIGFAAWIN